MSIFNIIIGVVTILGVCLAIPRAKHFILRNLPFLNKQQIEKMIIRPNVKEIEKYSKPINFKMLILLPFIIILVISLYLLSKGILKLVK